MLKGHRRLAVAAAALSLGLFGAAPALAGLIETGDVASGNEISLLEEVEVSDILNDLNLDLDILEDIIEDSELLDDLEITDVLTDIDVLEDIVEDSDLDIIGDVGVLAAILSAL